VKTGMEVLISVRNAIGGTDLGKLHQAVTEDFLKRDTEQQSVRSVMARMESDFIRRMWSFNMSDNLKPAARRNRNPFQPRRLGLKAAAQLKARQSTQGVWSVWE